MRKSCAAAVCFLGLLAFVCQAADSAPVRKADSSGICHEPTSPNYQQIGNYTAYATLEACLDSGGKLRKGAIPPPGNRSNSKAILDTDDPTLVKKSRGGICYDSSDGRFDSICNYTAYRNMKDCLDEGGRLPQ